MGQCGLDLDPLMIRPGEHAVRDAEHAERFSATDWGMVLTAADQNSARCDVALEGLCRTYWYPLYAYLRRRGQCQEDAKDLTQAFFERLLEKDFLSDVDRRKGRFRSFLLAALNNFLKDDSKRKQAEKRGGKVVFLHIDDRTAEEYYALEPVEPMDPDRIYERRWALTLLSQVLNRLEAEFCVSEEKRCQFLALRPFITRDPDAPSYAEVAARLGLSGGSLRVAIYRLRHRYGSLFREEIAKTLFSPREMEDEINHLFAVLA